MTVKITNPAQLIAWREAHGLTQEQAANHFFMKRRAYQNLEAGKLKKFPADKVSQIAEWRAKPMQKLLVRRRLD